MADKAYYKATRQFEHGGKQYEEGNRFVRPDGWKEDTDYQEGFNRDGSWFSYEVTWRDAKGVEQSQSYRVGLPVE